MSQNGYRRIQEIHTNLKIAWIWTRIHGNRVCLASPGAKRMIYWALGTLKLQKSRKAQKNFEKPRFCACPPMVKLVIPTIIRSSGVREVSYGMG